MPKAERSLEPVRGPRRVGGWAVAEESSGLVDQFGKLHGVDVTRVNGQDPPRGPGQNLGTSVAVRRSVTEDPAKPRDVRLQRQRRPRGRLVAPQLLDKSVQGDDTPRIQRQQREHRALLRATQAKLGSVDLSGHRTEETYPHARIVALQDLDR